MDPVTLSLIAGIIGLVIKYGAPVVVDAINSMNKTTITLEDITALEDLIKPPEQY
jgi:hypothetical protein